MKKEHFCTQILLFFLLFVLPTAELKEHKERVIKNHLEQFFKIRKQKEQKIDFLSKSKRPSNLSD